MTEPTLTGDLLKRSEWTHSWKPRQVSVEQDQQRCLLLWQGGANAGWIALGADCTLRLGDTQLTLRTPQRELYFRVAPGGPPLSEWHSAIAACGVRPIVQPPAFHKALAHFQPFDDALAVALGAEAPAIRLLDAALLRSGGIPSLARRQDLEAREDAAGFFLAPEGAAAALRAAGRRVCFVTHAWRTVTHPDPDGTTLAALLRFLRHPLGAHVVGLFVDFTCLYQWPRTAPQEEAYQAALTVIADACAPPHSKREPEPTSACVSYPSTEHATASRRYASPFGTCVARYESTPRCPEELMAVVALRGPSAKDGSAVRSALSGATRTKRATRKVGDVQYIEASGVWRAELGSTEEAEAAVAVVNASNLASLGGDARAFRWFNEATVAERGWCALALSNRYACEKRRSMTRPHDAAAVGVAAGACSRRARAAR
jgi:hypothetical protein